MNKNRLLAILPIFFLVSCSPSRAAKVDDVTNLKAAGINNGVVLKWNAVENADRYLIYKGNELYRETDNNFFTINFLDENEQYHLGVAAKNKNSVSKITYIDASPDAENDYDPFIDDLNTGLERLIGQSKINTFLNMGDVNTSSTNLYRFNNVINNMKNGVSQTIAYIGGSITVGEKSVAVDDNNHQKGYAYYSYKWLAEHYDRDNNSKFINASISGTDTCIATVRLEKDVLQYNPNLVFVEFVANNSGSSFDMRTYESLVRRILLQENNPAVILLFSGVDYSSSNQEGYARPIGNYYNIPMYSNLNALTSICENISQSRTDTIFSRYTEDGVHPTDQGHKLYAKGLVSVLKKLINQNKDDTSYAVPENPWREGYDCFVNLTYINNNTNTSYIQSTGSFVASDTSHRVLKDTADVEAFQNGWKKTDKNSNNSFVIKVRCKSFFIIYFAGNPEVPGDPEGTINASIQNDNVASDKLTLSWAANKTQKQSTLTSINDNGKGWGNPCCIIMLDKDVSDDYTLSIKMNANNETATLLAFGFVA